MTKDDALKLALEALEDALNKPMWDRPKMTKAITAIKEALAQPEQEPVAFISPGGHIHYDPYLDSVPLYTTPPKRPWVGLTDEQISQLWISTSPYFNEDDFARAVEAKLKEKNFD